MKSFILKSYQLQSNEKWIPTADIIEGINITEEFQLRDKEFDTKEEADKFIREFLIKRGFKENQLTKT